MILHVGELSIAADKIVTVSRVYGDKSLLRYNVTFVGGTDIEIYETRKGMNIVMPRREFVALWEKALTGGMEGV